MEGHCWEGAQEPSVVEGLVCAESGEKKTAEGEGWAGASPGCCHSSELVANFDLYLSELEFF